MNNAEKEIQLLHDTLEFLYYFNIDKKFQAEVNKSLEQNLWTAFYKRRPIMTYVQVLPAYSEIYQRYYRQIRMPKNFRWAGYKQPPGLFQEFLERCYRQGKTEYDRLLDLQFHKQNQRYLTDEELAALHEQQNVASAQKNASIAQALDMLAKKLSTPKVATKELTPTEKELKRYERSAVVPLNPALSQELKEEEQQALKPQPIAPVAIPEMQALPVIAPLKTAPLSPPTFEPEEEDVLPKLSLGADLDRFKLKPPLPKETPPPLPVAEMEDPIPSQETPPRETALNETIPQESIRDQPAESTPQRSPSLPNRQTMASSPVPQSSPRPAQNPMPPHKPSIRTGRPKPAGSNLLSSYTKRMGMFLMMIFLVMGVVMVLMFTLSNQDLTYSPPVSTLSTTVTNGNTNFNGLDQCSFYRGSEIPPSAKYKSQQLLSYFSEASVLSTIPPALLAGIARVESSGLVNVLDEDLENFGCPVSSTGALGIMQISPPGTIGYDSEAVGAGAKLLGKTVDNLTREDYCNPRTSIILAAGFVQKKLDRAGYLPTGVWTQDLNNDQGTINAVASMYYGCLRYGDPDHDCQGPHSYGEDLWNSMQGCQIINTTPGVYTPSTLTPNGQLETILQTARALSGNIDRGADGYYDRNVRPLTIGGKTSTYREGIYQDTSENGLYWCTTFVIDSYTLSGVPGLKLGTHEGVRGMRDAFEGTSGLVFVPYSIVSGQSSLEQVQPGFVMFQFGSTYAHDHVSIVVAKHIDDQGNGYITTIDSNASRKEYTFNVVGWTVHGFETIVGFGGVQ